MCNDINEVEQPAVNKAILHRSVWKSTDLPKERASMILQEFIGLFSRFMNTTKEKQLSSKQP